MWSPYGGWMRFPTDVPYGYGVTRWTLDPILRELAAGTPGVELLPGRTVAGLLSDDGRVAGVRVETPGRDSGRDSQTRAPDDPREACGWRRRSRLDCRASGARAGSGTPAQSLLLLRLLVMVRRRSSLRMLDPRLALRLLRLRQPEPVR
jgi:hypothetical protein